MSFFLCLSKELPDSDRITASPSSRYNPTPMKSVFMDFSKYAHPTSSQISASSLALIDKSNWFLSFFCPSVSFVVA